MITSKWGRSSSLVILTERTWMSPHRRPCTPSLCSFFLFGNADMIKDWARRSIMAGRNSKSSSKGVASGAAFLIRPVALATCTLCARQPASAELMLRESTVKAVVLSATGLDLLTAFSAVVACLNNTGPGLEGVGPASNYQALEAFQKWVLAFAMILGRLEIFTLLVVLTPTFWRR